MLSEEQTPARYTTPTVKSKFNTHVLLNRKITLSDLYRTFLMSVFFMLYDKERFLSSNCLGTEVLNQSPEKFYVGKNLDSRNE